MTDTDNSIPPSVNNTASSNSTEYNGYLLGNNGSGDAGEESMNVNSSADQDLENRINSVVKTEPESDSSSGSSSSGSTNSRASSNATMDYVVKLRGLPWSCTKDDVVDFLGSECKIFGDADGIHMVMTPDGKASGEALVELASEEDQTVALKKDKRNMGHRYIEVFKITRSEMEWILKRSRPAFNSGPFTSGRSPGSFSSETFVRLRGLPYECTKEDIHNFFHGLEIVSNGIQLMVDGMGRSSGEAYVQFASKDQAHKALGKDREMIKHRTGDLQFIKWSPEEDECLRIGEVKKCIAYSKMYVEIFTVSPSELRNMHSMVARGGRGSSGRAGPYDRPGGKSDSRYGGRPSRYFNKGRGFENDSWSSYDSWGSNGGGRSMNPPPLLPGLKRGRGDEGNTRHCVLMRGLPYRADELAIRKFFAPLTPTAVHIIYESSGRPSGTAKVNFASNDDVTRAMAKHKDRMDHRYIELFVHKT